MKVFYRFHNVSNEVKTSEEAIIANWEARYVSGVKSLEWAKCLHDLRTIDAGGLLGTTYDTKIHRVGLVEYVCDLNNTILSMWHNK